MQSLSSLKRPPVSSQLLICTENWNFSVSSTNPADTRACSQCLDPAMIVFCWRCIQQN